MNSKKSQHTFTNKLTVQIVLILAVAGSILLFEKLFEERSSVFKNVSNNEAVLSIDFDSMKKIFTGEVTEKMTVLDALNASVAAGKIKLVYYVDKDNNTKIAEINNHKANNESQFTFYINSQKLDQSQLNNIYIRTRDKIVIKLEQNEQGK